MVLHAATCAYASASHCDQPRPEAQAGIEIGGGMSALMRADQITVGKTHVEHASSAACNTVLAASTVSPARVAELLQVGEPSSLCW